MRFFNAFAAAARRHRVPLLSSPVLGLIAGLTARRLGAAPDLLAAVGIYLGSFVTLVLCARVVGRSFRGEDSGPRLYGDHLALILGLALLSRVLMALTLAPFQWSAPAWILLDPVLMGWPLDVLLVTVTLSFATFVPRGATVLAFVVVFVIGALGDNDGIAAGTFGAAGPLLEVLRFPWSELRDVPEALAAGGWRPAGIGMLRLVAAEGAQAGIGPAGRRCRSRCRSGSTHAWRPLAKVQAQSAMSPVT